jgi:hypothetical protein
LEEEGNYSSRVTVVKLAVQLLLTRPRRLWNMEHLFLKTEVVARNSDDQRKRRRPRQRWENIIKLGTVSKNTGSFYVAQDRNHWKSLAIQDNKNLVCTIPR